eukprot:g3533.t1
MGGGEVQDLNGVQDKSLGAVVADAKAKALRGGVTGAAAQGVNVLALMWLRTTLNVQIAKGGTMLGTIGRLYHEGGVRRFYRGLLPALIASPTARFGDTFANAGALAAGDSLPATRDAPLWAKTALASVCAGCMRIMLMPVDAWKTNKQVHGAGGLGTVVAKVRCYPRRSAANLWGWCVLWHGGVAQASATAVGHWPWFVVYNYLDASLPWDAPETPLRQKLARNAAIGMCASFVSDVSSNSLRVLKTYRQTAVEPVSYGEAFRRIRAESGLFGWEGFFMRGLQTRVVQHGINSAVFTVGWKIFQEAQRVEQGGTTCAGQ